MAFLTEELKHSDGASAPWLVWSQVPAPVKKDDAAGDGKDLPHLKPWRTVAGLSRQWSDGLI